MVKTLPAVQMPETRFAPWVRKIPEEGNGSLLQFLEKGMVTHPSILAWRIPWTEEPGGL